MQSKRRETERQPDVQSAERRWLIMIRQSARPFSPPTDVIELSDRLVVVVEIAGMRTHDFDITLLDRHLVISGLRERPQHSSPAYHRVEIGSGEFRIEVALPWPVEREGVSASYETGFLHIELPRKAARQIPVVDLDDTE